VFTRHLSIAWAVAFKEAGLQGFSSFDRMYELRELIKYLDGHMADSLGKRVKGIKRQIVKPVRIRQGD
jgi:hypothetical protein